MDCTFLNSQVGGVFSPKPRQRKPCPPAEPYSSDRPVGGGRETAAALVARIDDKALARALLAHNGHELGYFDVPQLAELHPDEIAAELQRRDALPPVEVNNLVAQGINGWVK